ncbi:NME7, partial [Symbiodinium microadriaticum]
VPVEEITAYMDKCSPCQSHTNTTLCIIKPHVVKSGDVGACLDAILSAGFQVEALFAVHMSIPIAEEIFGVYRGVFSAYSKTIEEVCSGPVLALMVSGSDNIVEEFRAFCGPIEPELAKVLRPDSLRARFGINSYRNGVHCT